MHGGGMNAVMQSGVIAAAEEATEARAREVGKLEDARMRRDRRPKSAYRALCYRCIWIRWLSA